MKNAGNKVEFGPNPYLSKKEEQDLEECICELGRKGFPRSKEDILDSVQAFLIANPRPTPFKDNRPGRGWPKGFLNRHPKISERKGESVTEAGACVSEKDIRKWFNQISDYLKEKGLENILENPNRIFNADESGFRTCPSSGQVFAEKGEKNVYTIKKGNSKESITVLFTISANGATCLPTIVYPYQRLPDRIRQSVPSEWGIALSQSGWMTADTFQFFIEHIFHPYLVENNIQFPVILFVDGHRSHLSYNLSLISSSLKIEIIALYPNSTHILQPADVALFRPVKQLWKSAVRAWGIENEGLQVNRFNFATVLKKVVERINKTCIINGFRACGLYPFNPNAVDYSKCLSSGNTQSTNNDISFNRNYPVLSFEEFKNIVGEEISLKFETYNEDNIQQPNSGELHILHKIWVHFNSKPHQTTTNNNQQIHIELTAKLNQAQTEQENQVQTEQENQVQTGQLKENEIQIQSRKPLKDYLSRPPEPKRKGKKSVARLSFNISSRDYQQALEDKMREKVRIEEEKKQRKHVREDKKRKAEEMKRLKSQKRMKNCKNQEINEPSTSKGETNSELCYTCRRTVTDILKCSECCRVYHASCIPKKHIEHIPSREDNDSFLCHLCYNVSEDSDISIESEEVDAILKDVTNFRKELNLD